MSAFENNMKLSARRDARDALVATLTEGLGCKSMSPEDDFFVFVFADGFNLGVYFVDEGDALSDADQHKAPWLELLVEDVEARGAALRKLDVAVVPYPRDPDHTYYQLPGGPVFRLASAS